MARDVSADPRRDFDTNRLLRACQIRDVDEQQAREAGRLRTRTGRAETISALDAIVVAFAGSRADPLVLTSDPGDLTALAQEAAHPIRVARA